MNEENEMKVNCAHCGADLESPHDMACHDCDQRIEAGEIERVQIGPLDV